MTPNGLVELVAILTSEVDQRTFEEDLFIVYFAACYGTAISARATPARRAELSRRLAPELLHDVASTRLERVIHDLNERVLSSAAMQGEALRLRKDG